MSFFLVQASSAELTTVYSYCKKLMEIKKGIFAPLSLVLFFFILYLFYNAPGIVFGDSAELALASACLGIPHAPGYPLYSLLTHGFHLILPSVEYIKACNIFSAFISAVTVGLFFRVLTDLNIRMAAAFSTCVIIGTSCIFFKQALINEVYSLNSFFFILSFLLIIKYHATKDVRIIYASSFLSGIALGNHHTMLSIVFIGSLYFFVIEKQYRYFLPALLFFIVGLSVYAYLPLRSLRNPVLDIGDPETLTAFLDVLLRKQFGFGNKIFSWDNLLLQNQHLANFINHQFYPFLLILMIAGMTLMFKKHKKLFFVFFAVFCINGILTVYSLKPDIDELFLVEEFLTPSIIAGAVFIPFTLDYLLIRRRVTGLIALFLVYMTLGVKFYNQRPEINQSDNEYATKIALDSLRILPEKAFIIGESDYSIYPLWYVQNISGIRKDVVVLDADFLMLPWYQKQNMEKMPVLKEIIPDISSHGKSGAKNRIDFSVLEDFKLNQSYKLAMNVKDKLKTEVFFTYDFGEMAKAFAPDIASKLKPHGPLYYVSFDGSFPFKQPVLDLKPFLNRLNLPAEEMVFLNPYVPYLLQEADKFYSSVELAKTRQILENIYLIDSKPGNAVNLALLLAETETDLKKANELIALVLKNSPVIDPKIYIVKGIIEMRNRNYSEAVKLLSSVEFSVPQTCQPKLYLFETFLRSKNTIQSKRYYETIMSQCPDYYKKRAMILTQNPN
jgi:hypothetical protein